MQQLITKNKDIDNINGVTTDRNELCSVTQMSAYFLFYLISDLIAKEFIQVLQLLWVGDFAIQRCVGLHHSCGAADSNSGVSFDPLAVMLRAVVSLWSVSGQGDCS